MVIFCYIDFMLQNQVRMESIWNYFITLFMMRRSCVLLGCVRESFDVVRYQPKEFFVEIRSCVKKRAVRSGTETAVWKCFLGRDNASQREILLRPSISSRLRDCDSACYSRVTCVMHQQKCTWVISLTCVNNVNSTLHANQTIRLKNSCRNL